MNLKSFTKTLRHIALWLILFWGFSLSAATYYVSTSGNDSYTESQAQSPSTPWKTIERVNLATFKTGDVVLFKRGEVFLGEVELSNGVTFASYGSGSEPVITGAKEIKNWTVYNNSIYVASVDLPVKYLFANNKQMTLARFPNSGFLYTDKGTGPIGFTDLALSQEASYWKGANVKLYVRDYSIILKKVKSYIATTIAFEDSASMTISGDNAYFFDNKFEELDVEKEWYYDEVNKKLYFYAPGGANPNTMKIEGVAYDFGFKGGRNAANIIIKDFRIEKQAMDGIFLYDGSGLNHTIANNKFYQQGENGISYMGKNVRIEKNHFEDVNGRGIIGNVTTNSFILNNTFKRIGLNIGLGINNPMGYTNTGAIVLGSHSSYVQIAYNDIDSTGSTAIRPDGNNHTIEKNIIKYPLLTYADGGGIYLWGDISHHSIIRNNFIFYPQGAGNGKPGGLAYGIYLDMDAHHCSVVNNSIIGSKYGGILINSGNHDHLIKGNVSFANEMSALKFDDFTQDAPVYNNTVSKNILYTINGNSPCLHLNSKVNRYNFGKSDSNYYCNPYADFLVRRSQYTGFPAFSIDQWQALFQQDLKTKKSQYRWEPYEVSQVLGTSLISNGNFDTNLAGWSYWGSSSIQYVSATGLDDGNLKFTILDSTKANGFAISPTFAVVQDQYYELSFSVKSSKPGRINAILRQAHSPYSTIYSKSFPLDVARKDYKHVIKMPLTDAQLRLDLEILIDSKEYWIDNVKLIPVKINYHKGLDRSFVFTNPSDQATTVALTKAYRDLDGKSVTGSIKLDPWSSKVLVIDLNPPISLRTPENPVNAVNGIDYSYYEGNWNTIPDFTSLTAVKDGILDSISLAPRNKNDLFAFSFSGYINVPANGIYTFYTSSDDGSKLYIGDSLVVDNDGLHALGEKSGTIGLKAGKHIIKVMYLEKDGQEILNVSYAGPNLAKTILPAAALFSTSAEDKLALREPENPISFTSGLDYAYYEGSWSAIPDFTKLTPIKKGKIDNFSLSPRNKNDLFAFSFSGYIEVPANGVYTFYTSSDDGSKLYIGDELVVNNDGLHALAEKSGTIGLKAGKHLIKVMYLEKDGQEILNVNYSGPDILKTAVPLAALYCLDSSGLRNPENPANAVNGLDYSYYEGNWNVIPNFTALTPVKNGTIDNFSLSPRNKNDLFAFSFSGYINVPANGVYTFYTSSDDGSRLYIGNTLVVDNDGLHALEEKSGTIGLKAGKHLIKVMYLEKDGQEVLNVNYSGPGISKAPVSASSLFRKSSASARVTRANDEDEVKDIERLVIYPNPAQREVLVSASESQLHGVDISNDKGIRIFEAKNIKDKELRIQVSNWPGGLYIIQVIYSTGRKELKRLMVGE